jgi:hypothetical protein
MPVAHRQCLGRNRLWRSWKEVLVEMSDTPHLRPAESTEYRWSGPGFWAFTAGAAVGVIGGLIGLGGAEFRLPLLIGIFGFAALQAVILNKAMSLIVVITALPARLIAVPWTEAGSVSGRTLYGEAMAPRAASASTTSSAVGVAEGSAIHWIMSPSMMARTTEVIAGRLGGSVIACEARA